LENLLLLGAVYFQVFFSEIRAHTFFSVCSVRCILVLMPFLLYIKNV
jgi:DsbC/DsbD-like thiol-disulfide interchange protein